MGVAKNLFHVDGLKRDNEYKEKVWSGYTIIYMSGVHLRGGEGGPSPPPRKAPAPPRIQVSYFFTILL